MKENYLFFEDELINIVKEVVSSVYPLVGKLDCQLIDTIATQKYNRLYDVFGIDNINFLAIEGERDGVIDDKIYKSKTCFFNKKNRVICSIDPIDGTKTAAYGGSRAVTVLAVALNDNIQYKAIPDRLSCFCVASNKSLDFLKFITDLQSVDLHDKNISTVRRAESDILWSCLLGSNYINGIEGENTFYMPNKYVGNLFLAGDTSITLFLESDYFIGRVGAAEARIESRLWKHWSGFLVSGNKMKKYRGGMLRYLEDRIDSLKNSDKYNLQQFFEEDEIQQLKQNDWSKNEVLQLLSDSFSPNYDYIVIGSITGTYDKKLPIHSKKNLIATSFDYNKGTYNIPMYIKDAYGERISVYTG